MTKSRDLEEPLYSPDDTSGLGKWYSAVRDTSIDEMAIGDLAVAIRQELWLSETVPPALRALANEPDEDLAFAVAGIEERFWRANLPLLRAAVSTLSRLSMFEGREKDAVEAFVLRFSGSFAK